MSLPLTRRIARAALLIAAGAAPVVGAAGSAGAVALPQAPIGGLSAADGLSGTVSGATAHSTELAGATGGKAVEQAVPGTGKTVTSAGKTAAPVAQKATGDVVGGATGSLGAEELPTESLTGGGLPTEKLPVKDLPLG